MLKEGYLYHLKDAYFDLINDGFLTKNKSGKRPSYFVLKEENSEILWFIPLSTKVKKYKKIVEHKIKKYGRCSTVLIIEIAKKEQAVLIQNAFPTIAKFVDTFHMIDNVPVHVTNTLRKKIEQNFDETMKVYKTGLNLFFSDIEKFRNIMLQELEKDKIVQVS